METNKVHTCLWLFFFFFNFYFLLCGAQWCGWKIIFFSARPILPLGYLKETIPRMVKWVLIWSTVYYSELSHISPCFCFHFDFFVRFLIFLFPALVRFWSITLCPLRTKTYRWPFLEKSVLMSKISALVIVSILAMSRNVCGASWFFSSCLDLSHGLALRLPLRQFLKLFFWYDNVID